MISDKLALTQSATMDGYSRPSCGFITAHPMRWGEYYSSNPRTHKGFGYTDGLSKYRNNFHACHPLPIVTKLQNFENHMLPRALTQRIQDKVLTEHQHKRRVKRHITHQVFPTNNFERSDKFGDKALCGATRDKLRNYWTQLLDTPKNVQVYLDHRDEIGRRVAALLRRKREQKARDNYAISEYLQNCHLDGIRQPQTWLRKSPQRASIIESQDRGHDVSIGREQRAAIVESQDRGRDVSIGREQRDSNIESQGRGHDVSIGREQRDTNIESQDRGHDVQIGREKCASNIESEKRGYDIPIRRERHESNVESEQRGYNMPIGRERHESNVESEQRAYDMPIRRERHESNVESEQRGYDMPIGREHQPETYTYIQRFQRPLTPHQPLPLVPVSAVSGATRHIGPEQSAMLAGTQNGHEYMRRYVVAERQLLNEGVSDNLKVPERTDVNRICPVHNDVCFRIDCPYRVSLTVTDTSYTRGLGDGRFAGAYLPTQYEYMFEPTSLSSNVPTQVNAAIGRPETVPYYGQTSAMLPSYQYPEPFFMPQSKDQMVSDEDQYQDCYSEPVSRVDTRNNLLEHSSSCCLKERKFLRPRAKPALVTSIATWNEGKKVTQSRKKVRFSDEYQIPAIKSDIPPFYKFKEQNFSAAHIGYGDDCPNPMPEVYYTANEQIGKPAEHIAGEYPRFKSWLSPTAHDIPQILYKSDLHKRYHATHFEPVPDLRDFTTYHKQYFFNGYHTSALRG